VDSLRGLAVLCMIQLHTSHGWLRPDLRSGPAWNAAQFFGGLAAPGFLLLAGVSLGMQWSREGQASRLPAFVSGAVRALQLIVLGYVLRLQMWSIDSGAMARPGTYPAQLCLLAGYAGAYYGFGELRVQLRRALSILLGAAVVWSLGLTQVIWFEPHRVRGLLRVDVLQCIGASLVVLNGIAAASAKRVSLNARPWLLIAAAVVVGILTPWLRERVPGPLPHALAAYLGQWPGSDTKPVFALFPLFPWLGFACVGAALGLLWSRAASHGTLERALIMTVAIGAWLALFTSEAWPPMFAFARDHAWLSAVVRLAYKVGLVLAMLGLALGLARPSARIVAAPVMALGRTSLLVYWVHLEFAFGAASRPIARKLDIGMWAIGTLALIGAMWLLSVARLQTAGRGVRWRLRRPAAS
jgi:uncharacterized membrane protein